MNQTDQMKRQSKDLTLGFLLNKYYSEEDIKEVVLNPRRGVWFEKVLNFWTKVLNIEIDKEVYQKAIFRIAPIAK